MHHSPADRLQKDASCLGADSRAALARKQSRMSGLCANNGPGCIWHGYYTEWEEQNTGVALLHSMLSTKENHYADAHDLFLYEHHLGCCPFVQVIASGRAASTAESLTIATREQADSLDPVQGGSDHTHPAALSAHALASAHADRGANVMYLRELCIKCALAGMVVDAVLFWVCAFIALVQDEHACWAPSWHMLCWWVFG